MLGTVMTLLNLTRLGPGSTSSFGTYVGLRNADRVTIMFRGSYGASAGTTAQLDIYAAYKPSPGSVDTAVIGSIVLAAAANTSKQRSKYCFGTLDLAGFPYIVVKAKHRTGTVGLYGLLAKAIIK
jgi:hypothetical protein